MKKHNILLILSIFLVQMKRKNIIRVAFTLLILIQKLFCICTREDG
jgi:hypothetical protein